MSALHISRGGQVSLPAEIRRRWATDQVLAEDRGDSVVLRPMPADPVAAARGALGPSRISTDESRRQERDLEARRDRRRYGAPPPAR